MPSAASSTYRNSLVGVPSPHRTISISATTTRSSARPAQAGPRISGKWQVKFHSDSHTSFCATKTDGDRFLAAQRSFKLTPTGETSSRFTSLFMATTARALAPATRRVGRHWWRSLSSSTGNELRQQAGPVSWIYPNGSNRSKRFERLEQLERFEPISTSTPFISHDREMAAISPFPGRGSDPSRPMQSIPPRSPFDLLSRL